MQVYWQPENIFKIMKIMHIGLLWCKKLVLLYSKLDTF